jgi:hypothetical protein
MLLCLNDIFEIAYSEKKSPEVHMTYNFDPDRWYENELFVIQSKVKTGQMTEQEYNEAVEELDQKQKKMWERLDGTYQMPN